MTKNGKFLILLIFIVAGILIGGLIAELCRDVAALSWLSYGKSLGISTTQPFVLDLVILRFSLGFMIDINIAMLIGILTSLFLYKKFV